MAYSWCSTVLLCYGGSYGEVVPFGKHSSYCDKPSVWKINQYTRICRVIVLVLRVNLRYRCSYNKQWSSGLEHKTASLQTAQFVLFNRNSCTFIVS